MIKSQIILDSLSPAGTRLTTWILEYPRYVHAELMTHRVFSKNSASSRAIPIEKMIEEVKNNPVIPVHWGKNQKGMQAEEELSNDELTFIDHDGYGCDIWSKEEYLKSGLELPSVAPIGKLDAAKEVWLHARDCAIYHVEQLMKIGLHKQQANRILEPWFHIKIILSATDFENWFALRAHKDAAPDIRKLAEVMLEQYNASNPQHLNEGEWHIPFGDKFDEDRIIKILGRANGDGWVFSPASQLGEAKKKIAVARCARISYLNYEGKDDYEADIKLCERLFGNNPKHLSPTEHVAQALALPYQIGNFCGFKQYRKFFMDENLKDPRVIKKK